MENEEKKKLTHTKAELISSIARATKYRSKIVREVYESLEEFVAKHLSQADEEIDISVRLFEGISINSTFSKAKTKYSNLTGENIDVPDRIISKARVTRNYCDKLTELSNENNDGE